MKFRLRMLSTHHRQLTNLLSDHTKEQACFLVCRTAKGESETLILVHDVVALRDGELLVHAPDQLSISPQGMLRVVRAAQQADASICMVHTHPMSVGEVGFSLADDIGNSRTFEFFNRMLPGKLNSCLVWDRELRCVAGRAYTTSTDWLPMESVDVIGDNNRLRLMSRIESISPAQNQIYERQARILGAEGQRIVASLRVGVIGCGGIGSVAATVLGHSGVSDLTLVDFDVVEKTNLPRLLGAHLADAESNLSKVEVLQRELKLQNPQSRIRCISAPVEDPSILGSLVELDALVCATDDTTSRAYLNQLCQQYFVPLLDLGVQFVADPETGLLVREIGKVNLVLPGSPCLSCVGHIDGRVLAEEGLPPEVRNRRYAEGYIRGADTHEPAMMVFNMQIAARGIQLLLAWATGLHAVNVGTYERVSFLGLAGSQRLSLTRKHADSECLICSAASLVWGAGDQHPMLVRARRR